VTALVTLRAAENGPPDAAKVTIQTLEEPGCGNTVDGRLKSCGQPAGEKKIRRMLRRHHATVTLLTSLRAAFRLIDWSGRVKSSPVRLPLGLVDVNVHRFEEIIGGRAYQIEVTHVRDRWRAEIRRIPGMPTALMPFYGQTPDEAAHHLSQWLTLAHSRQTAV